MLARFCKLVLHIGKSVTDRGQLDPFFLLLALRFGDQRFANPQLLLELAGFNPRLFELRAGLVQFVLPSRKAFLLIVDLSLELGDSAFVNARRCIAPRV